MRQFLKIHSREELDVAEALIDLGFEPKPDGTFACPVGCALVIIPADRAKTFDSCARFIGAPYFDKQYSEEYRKICVRLSQALIARVLQLDEANHSEKKAK